MHVHPGTAQWWGLGWASTEVSGSLFLACAQDELCVPGLLALAGTLLGGGEHSALFPDEQTDAHGASALPGVSWPVWELGLPTTVFPPSLAGAPVLLPALHTSPSATVALPARWWLRLSWPWVRGWVWRLGI